MSAKKPEDGKKDGELTDKELNSISGGTDGSNVDFQNTLQKQQQTLQMLSTISKLEADTAVAVVRKIGG